MTNLDSILKSRDILCQQSSTESRLWFFPIVMYGCESWTIKKAKHRRFDAFELWCWRRLLSPLDCKEIQPVHPKGDQSWIFIGRTDVEAETPIFWPPDGKTWLIWKDPGAQKDWGQEERGMTEDEMVGWQIRWPPLTQWTWVWVNSRSWWWTGRPAVLWFMGSQRVGHDWATELNCTEYASTCLKLHTCHLIVLISHVK